MVDSWDADLCVPLRCLPAGSIVRLLGRHTPCYHGSVPGKEIMKGSNRNVEKRYTLSTAESHLGASSLVTAHSAREGRVCWLKRFGPSKVVTEAGLSGLGLPPRPLSSQRPAVLFGKGDS